MTAARLSPAASLLRNSKLFGLPQAIALPTPEPSSEQVPRSDTATTIHPTRAAIETPLTSLGTGDWGFKRPLPLKSTTKSNAPVIRLNKGIDTAEHIADFDSAADHVLTLKKFQELNQSIQHPSNRSYPSKVHQGVFRKGYDNTTNVSSVAPAHLKYAGVWPSLSPTELQKQMPEKLYVGNQDATSVATEDASPTLSRVAAATKPKRWRFDGPSLIQMSGYEFDRWIATLDSAKRAAFREVVKQNMLARLRNSHTARAQDAGTVGEVDPATLQVSEDEVADELRRLRQQPAEFGRLIAEFLDLPEGPPGTGQPSRKNQSWDYGRRTLASDTYEDSGPPRTHPSAGLSYFHTDRWAQNHAVFGPQEQKLPTVARQVKTRVRGTNNITTLGVAGFIVEKQAYKGTGRPHEPPFQPQAGGQKTVVRLDRAEIDERGALKYSVKAAPEYLVEDEKAVHHSMHRDAKKPAARPSRSSGPRVMEPLIRNQMVAPTYKQREELSSDSGDDFAFLNNIQ